MTTKQINFNGKNIELTKIANKTYISSRNSHNGKGKWHFVWIDTNGKKFVRFWSEQFAELTGSHDQVMGHCYDIVK